MISQSSQQQNKNFDKIAEQIANKDIMLNSAENSLHGELSQLIQDFDKMDTNEVESMTSSSKQIVSQNILSENDLSITVNMLELKQVKILRKHLIYLLTHQKKIIY